MINGRQIRAARALLDMSQDELAEAAGLTPQAIRKIEGGSVMPREGTIADITKVFGDRNIEFTDFQGVRHKPNEVEIFEGPDRFDEFYNFIYEHLKKYGGDVCIGSSNARLYAKYRREPELHRQRMRDLAKTGKIRFRILAEKGDEHLTASSYAEYRWQSKETFAPTSFYAFGNCLALISFVHDPAPYVVLHKSGPFAEAYRQAFNLAWEKAEEPNLIHQENKATTKIKEK